MIVVGMALAVLVAGIFTVRYVLNQISERNLAAKLLQRQDIKITIIEGKRREEIAAQLEAAGITKAADFLAATTKDEGHLFPDTYRFYANTPAQEIAATMVNNFTKRMNDLAVTPETLILASIVERESINDADRPVIAGVYLNRLKLGMKLQADPTVEYAKASNDLAKHPNPAAGYTYWPTITRADYQGVTSPYNTYLVDALPAGPICSPGRKSIEAVLSPATHNYIFFGYKDGKLLLATTLAQHEAQL